MKICQSTLKILPFSNKNHSAGRQLRSPKDKLSDQPFDLLLHIFKHLGIPFKKKVIINSQETSQETLLHNLKETIETNFDVVKKRQPFGHIEWMVKSGLMTIPAASGL